MSGGRIKGAAIREFFAYLHERFGAEHTERMLGVLSPADREIFLLDLPGLGIVSGHWYESRPIHQLCDFLVEGLTPAEEEALAREAAIEVLGVTLKGVHRAVLRAVGSPRLHARFAQRLWNTYYDHGSVTVTLRGERESEVAYRDWDAHHPFLCQFTSASDYVVYGAMGLDDVTVEQTRCVSRGDADCAHLVGWAG